MKHGVDVRLSIFHVPLDYTIPFPDLHIPTPSFSCVSWARCPEPKSCYLIQLKMLFCTLPPFLQIQYFTLLVGILGHLLKLQGRGGDIWAAHHTTQQSSAAGHLTVAARLCLLKKTQKRKDLRENNMAPSVVKYKQMSIWAPNDVPVLKRNGQITQE